LISPTINEREYPATLPGDRCFFLMFLLDNRTNVLYMETMKEKRTTRSVQKLIVAFFRANRRMPSFGEMIDLLGVRSKSVVNFWINKLVDAEILEKDGKGRLTFTKRSFAIPIVGSVQAGFPSPEEESLCDIMSMDEYLVTKPDASFLLQVSGDSMIGEGILEGDLVIVEKDRQPKNGDVVIAEVDGEWTIKYFKRQGKQIVLEAANPKYPIIKPRTELRLGGVVTAVIRKYHQ
jgi:SOS regulatory protein LexA